ncbi:uncharacterized protein LOC143550304 [Bidens hawaiensis]|uniref:uncharacterized protein LOC143550304 n=1 Tax=Bidens hawaiensis TaxID=980011 RepID=UPI00404A923F
MRSQSQKRINCYQFEDDSEYDSDGSDMPSFVSYQEEEDYYYHEHHQPIYEEDPQYYNHGGTYQRNYQQDQEDSSGNKEVSWKDVMDLLKEMKRDQEAHNQALNRRLELQETFNIAQDKLVSQLLEEVAQIEREKEKLASGAMVDEEVIEEDLDQSENEVENVVVETNTTPIPPVTEEPLNATVIVADDEVEGDDPNLLEHRTEYLDSDEEILVEEAETKIVSDYPDNPLLHIIHINKVGDDDLNSNKKKVKGKNSVKNGKKWGHVGSTDMLTMRRKVWAQHLKYRAYTGNSVGKCSVRPRPNPSALISRKRVRARCVNYWAYVGNVEGKCAFTPARVCSLDLMNVKEETELRQTNYRAYMGNSIGKCSIRLP